MKIKREFESYSELLEYVDNHDDVEYILNYNEFAIVKIDDEYWYFEQGENDCDDFCKCEIIAELSYSTFNDIKLAKDEELSYLFDCDFCGETDIDDDGNIQYLWFKQVKGE